MYTYMSLQLWGVLGGVSLECFHGIGAGIGTAKHPEPDPQCDYVSYIHVMLPYVQGSVYIIVPGLVTYEPSLPFLYKDTLK